MGITYLIRAAKKRYIIRNTMQKDKIANKSATLQLRGVDTVLEGKIIEQGDGGFWFTMNKDTIMKIAGRGTPPQEVSQTYVFIPFSSIFWLKLDD